MELFHYIERGGLIVYLLIALNIIGYSIMVWKALLLLLATKKREQTALKLLATARRGQTDEHHIDAAVALEVKRMEFGLNTVKIIASIAPLLGLLGTVIGVLSSFDAISTSGLGDPAIFSGGISVALITTVTGLIVSIPHYIGYNYITGMLDGYELKLLHTVRVQA